MEAYYTYSITPISMMYYVACGLALVATLGSLGCSPRIKRQELSTEAQQQLSQSTLQSQLIEEELLLELPDSLELVPPLASLSPRNQLLDVYPLPAPPGAPLLPASYTCRAAAGGLRHTELADPAAAAPGATTRTTVLAPPSRPRPWGWARGLS